jgi:hypothetical protein
MNPRAHQAAWPACSLQGQHAVRPLRIAPVQTIRHHLQRWAFIAIFAVVGMALAPTLSQAVMAASGVQWTEICSATGSRWVQLDSSAEPTTGGPAAMVDMSKCPACCHLGHSAGLPPAPLALPALIGGAHAVPVLFLHAPRPLFAWAAAQPRGPPTLG